MPRLSNEDRDKIIQQFKDGSSCKKVNVSSLARQYGTTRSTIFNLLQRVEKTGTTQDRQRSGRPRVTNFRTSHRIVQQHVQDKDLSAAETARKTIGTHGKTISRSTVARRLREHNVIHLCSSFTKRRSVSQMAEVAQAIPVPPVIQGDAVFLTPYLKEGQRFAAQDASYVNLPFLEGACDLDSWSGYLSVGPSSSYHLYFWFFCCTKMTSENQPNKMVDNSSSPLLVWLNGGPGNSSMVGLFEEIGPLKANANGTVSSRDIAWTNHFDIIFIDDLMDTGFSYSDSGQKTASVKEAAEHLYEFLDQFYQLFPETKVKDLYIGGQSYGGKYAPELAQLVSKDKTMNLKGVFLSSGLMNPRQMLPVIPEYLVNMGMLNDREAIEMKDSLEESFDKHKQDPKGAVYDIVSGIFGRLEPVMGHNNADNILYIRDYGWTLETYLNQPDVQKAIHAKPTQFAASNEKIIESMADDFLDGVQGPLGSLLNAGIKVLVYNGQLDPVVSVLATEEFLSNLAWVGNEEYVAGHNKVVWKDSYGTVAGYVTKVDNLTRVVVRNAGHRTAIDQPWWVLDMMRKFIADLSFRDSDEPTDGASTSVSD